MATGIKRGTSGGIVFYQATVIGFDGARIVHAARGENITVIFINNTVYGMTGGQMAPTTLPGQKTTTSPYGRDTSKVGYPIRVSEMLATLDGPSYIERVSVHDPKHIIKAGRAIRKAFEMQIAGKGFSLVEVLSTCPTNWGLTPVKALERLKEQMIPYYPLGVFRAPEEVAESDIRNYCAGRWSRCHAHRRTF